jgi:ABC-type multidrug transport system ATPase subunit
MLPNRSQLLRLLLGLFSPEELRTFVGTLPDGETLTASLPGRNSSHADVAESAVSLLLRHGLVGTEFFARLISLRPRRLADILPIASEFGCDLSQAGEIAALLANMEDRSVETRIRAIADSRSAARPITRETILTLAELAQWHANQRRDPRPDRDERQDIADRLLSLTGELIRGDHGESVRIEPSTSQQRRALSSLRFKQLRAIHAEIQAFVQEGDGVRASKRLLDLTKHFAVDPRHVNESIVLDLGLRGSSLPAAGSDARKDWLAQLHQILALADVILDAYRCDEPQTLDSVSQPREQLVCMSGLHKRHRHASTFQLRGVDLSVSRASIVGIIGPNGAGKSTLLRIIVGELAPDGGSLRYPGLASGKRGDWRRIRQRISYVPQRPPPWHGALDESLYAWAARCGLRGDACIGEADYYIQRLGLSEHRTARWEQTSGGLQVRYELARAMIGAPDLLVLDEPLAFLDIRSQEQFLQDLRSIVRSYETSPAIVLSSQHIHEVESIADVLLYLDPSGMAMMCGGSDDSSSGPRPRVFELRGSIPPACMDAVTKAFGLGRARFHGDTLVLEAPPSMSLGSVAQQFTEHGAELLYVRDITNSAVSLFREGGS